MLGRRSLVSLYLKTYSQLIACIGQKLTVFLSSSHEWPVQQTVIKRGLSFTKDSFLMDYYVNLKMCRQSLEMGKNLLDLIKMVLKLANICSV